MMSEPNPQSNPEVGPSPSNSDAPPTVVDSSSGGGLIDRLLDPKALQTLMLGGGGLTILGLVIWLVAIGLFENPLWAAAGLTSVNLGLLAAGVGVAGRTRFRTAGRAVAMLSSIVLPLNLWFYDAQGVITLDDGGNLWIPALVCCVIYAGIARYLKDSMFVYTFVGGIALCGLLFLADASVGHFWEVLAPSTLLVAIGTLAIHAERLFPVARTREEEVAFTRNDFGLAFFRAGHSLLAAGLLLLLGGRVVGWFYESYFEQFNLFAMPDVALVGKVQFAALLLVLVGAYNYAYSRLVVASDRQYSISSLLTLCWAIVIGFDLLNVTLTTNLAVGILASLALVCRFLEWQANDSEENTHETGSISKLMTDVSPVAGMVAHVMAGIALMMSLSQLVYHLDSEYVGWDFFLSTGLVFCSFVVGLCSRPHVGTLQQVTYLSKFRAKYLCTGALLTLGGQLIAANELLSLVSNAGILTLLLLVPMAAFVLTSVGRKLPYKNDVLWSATLVSSLIVFVSFAFLSINTLSGGGQNMAIFYGLASAFYAGVALQNGKTLASSFSAVLACLSVWQGVEFFELGFAIPLFVMSLAGFAVVAFTRLSNKFDFARMGQLLVVLGNAAGGLLVANRLAADEVSFTLLAMLLGQVVLAFLTNWLLSTDWTNGTSNESGNEGADEQANGAEQPAKSPVLIVMGVVGLLLAGLTLNNLSDLTGWQRFELLVTSAGAFMLVAGHIGWYREGDPKLGEVSAKPNAIVDLNLWVGSFFATLPCTLSLLSMRLWSDAGAVESLVHETGALLVGLLLLGTGVLCRLRSTTLMGGATVSLYLVSLVALIHVPDQLQNVAVYLMVGGGLFFGTAVMLSVYRDRLLAVTEQVREREGVFSVLRWR